MQNKWKKEENGHIFYRQLFNLFQARKVLEATIFVLRVLAKHTFPAIIYFLSIRIDLYSFYKKNFIAPRKIRYVTAPVYEKTTIYLFG